ncbi:auxin-induced protein X15 [Ipomoea triloba]|uniref:auxin-induced protein X15 n=1 Tax=Ipomoea triloba TaxID=35885 RepID=UPI00125D6B38|nr:auxin-induced protein X15 [Ipomoea triloba]
MLGKKISSMKKLAKKACSSQQHHECLLIKQGDDGEGRESPSRRGGTPTGAFAVYVGEERRRFVVPTSYLSHPLFKILLEKAYDEFGFAQSGGLLLPCSVKTFQQVVHAVECCNGQFHFGELVHQFH